MSGADASQESMNPDRWRPTLHPACFPWPPRRPAENMTADEIAATDEDAQAMNAYNARVSDAVDSFLACAGRWAVAIVGGAFLGVHAINVLLENLP